MHNLIRGVSKTAAGSIATVVLSMGTVKLVSVIAGPAGVGLLSICKQSLQTLSMVGLGTQTAVTQGIAARATTAERLQFLSTVLPLFLIGVPASLLSLWLISRSVLPPSLSGVSTPLFIPATIAIALVANAYLLGKSALNGVRAIGTIALIDNAGPLLLLTLAYPLARAASAGDETLLFGFLGLAQLLMLSITLWQLSWRHGLRPFFSRISFSPSIARSFLAFVVPTLLSAAFATLAMYVVRVAFVHSGGLHSAGEFDAAWTISMTYLMFLLGSFGTYYMPTLSQTRDAASQQELIRQVFQLASAAAVPLVVALICVKPFAIRVLYADSFSAATEMLRWSLMADYLKVTTWLLTIPFLARGKVGVYFWLEVTWYGLFSIAIWNFREHEALLETSGQIFLGLYACSTVYLILYCRLTGTAVIPLRLLLNWLLGFCTILLASAYHWRASSVDWTSTAAWIALSVLVGLYFAGPDIRKAALSILYRSNR